MINKKDSIIGCLIGTAVGDALGLTFEGLSKKRQQKFCKEIKGHHFLFNKGMVSDDTEHTRMTAQALIVSNGDVDAFLKSFAWKLRFWLLGLPAGIGLATLKSIIKLWFGFSGRNSGIFSAGNGPAMRSAIIGACYGEDEKKLKQLIKACTRITHMASLKNYISGQEYYEKMEKFLEGENAKEFLELLKKIVESLNLQKSTEMFAKELGLEKGITGYIYHTVPVALYCWLKNQQDYKSAIQEIIRCGGDTDTTAAITGGIAGAGAGINGIPQEWIKNLWEFPADIGWMEKLGTRLAEVCHTGVTQKSLYLPFYAIFFRNVFFMIIVLLHGFRRLLPPY